MDLKNILGKLNLGCILYTSMLKTCSLVNQNMGCVLYMSASYTRDGTVSIAVCFNLLLQSPWHGPIQQAPVPPLLISSSNTRRARHLLCHTHLLLRSSNLPPSHPACLSIAFRSSNNHSAHPHTPSSASLTYFVTSSGASPPPPFSAGPGAGAVSFSLSSSSSLSRCRLSPRSFSRSRSRSRDLRSRDLLRRRSRERERRLLPNCQTKIYKI